MNENFESSGDVQRTLRRLAESEDAKTLRYSADLALDLVELAREDYVRTGDNDSVDFAEKTFADYAEKAYRQIAEEIGPNYHISVSSRVEGFEAWENASLSALSSQAKKDQLEGIRQEVGRDLVVRYLADAEKDFRKFGKELGSATHVHKGSIDFAAEVSDYTRKFAERMRLRNVPQEGFRSLERTIKNAKLSNSVANVLIGTTVLGTGVAALAYALIVQ